MSVPPKCPPADIEARNAALKALGARARDTGQRVPLETPLQKLEAPTKSFEELLGLKPPRPATRGYAIGIDQSPNHTGVVVLGQDGALLCAATIEPLAQGHKDRARLRYIRDQLELLCREHGPFEVGVWESYSMNSKHRAFLLGEVGGIVQLALDTHAAQVFSAAPTALKKFTTGRHLADKKMMKSFVSDASGAVFEDDNLADAYALAQLGRALLAPAPTTRKQAEVRAAILSTQGDALSAKDAGRVPKAKKKRTFRMNKGML